MKLFVTLALLIVLIPSIVAQTCPGALVVRFAAFENFKLYNYGGYNLNSFGAGRGGGNYLISMQQDDMIQDQIITIGRSEQVIAFQVFSSAANINLTSLIASVSFDGRAVPRSTTGSPDTRWKYTTVPPIDSQWAFNAKFNDSTWLTADHTTISPTARTVTRQGLNFVNQVSANGNTNPRVYNAWSCIYRADNTFVAARLSEVNDVQCMSTDEVACVPFATKNDCLAAVDRTPANANKVVSCTTSGGYSIPTNWCNIGRMTLRPWNQTAQWVRPATAATSVWFRIVIDLTALASEPPCFLSNDLRTRRLANPGQQMTTLNVNSNDGKKGLLTIRANADDFFVVSIGQYSLPCPYGLRPGEYNIWVDYAADILITILSFNTGGPRWFTGSVMLDGIPVAMTDGRGLPWKSILTDGGPGPAPQSDWNQLTVDDSAWFDMGQKGVQYGSADLFSYSIYVSPSQQCQPNAYWLDALTPPSGRIGDTMWTRLVIPVKSQDPNTLIHPCACPENSRCTGAIFQCNPGFNQSSRTTCAPCPSGTFKLDYGSKACTACPAGATCTSTTLLCGTGTYQDGSNCPRCPDGSFKIGSGNDMCAPCPVGSRCTASALTTCTSGYTYVDSVCQPCPAKTFKSDDGFGKCTTCPKNATCTTVDFVCDTGFIKQDGACILIVIPRTVDTTVVAVTTAAPVTSTTVAPITTSNPTVSNNPDVTSTPTAAPAGKEEPFVTLLKDNMTLIIVIGSCVLLLITSIVVMHLRARNALKKQLKQQQDGIMNMLLTGNGSMQQMPTSMMTTG